MVRNALLLGVLSFAAACGPTTTEFPMKEQNTSGQNGTAKLEQRGDTLVVDVELTAGNANGPESAHIHTGKCGAVGAIIAALPNVEDGKIHAELADPTVELSKLLAEPHIINVHSHDDSSVYVSCGDIR